MISVACAEGNEGSLAVVRPGLIGRRMGRYRRDKGGRIDGEL